MSLNQTQVARSAQQSQPSGSGSWWGKVQHLFQGTRPGHRGLSTKRPSSLMEFHGGLLKARWVRGSQGVSSSCAQFSDWFKVKKQDDVTGWHHLSSGSSCSGGYTLTVSFSHQVGGWGVVCIKHLRNVYQTNFYLWNRAGSPCDWFKLRLLSCLPTLFVSVFFISQSLAAGARCSLHMGSVGGHSLFPEPLSPISNKHRTPRDGLPGRPLCGLAQFHTSSLSYLTF